MLAPCNLAVFSLLVTSLSGAVGKDVQHVDDFQKDLESYLVVRQMLVQAEALNPGIRQAKYHNMKIIPNQMFIYSNVTVNATQCDLDLIYTIEDLIFPGSKDERSWALQFVDAFGKPPSGLLRGQMVWIGNYDECLKVSAPPSIMFNSSVGGFQGRYAWLTFTLNQTISNSSMSINVGACLPSSCVEENSLTQDYNLLIKLLEQVSWLKKYVSDFPTLEITFVPMDFPLTAAPIVCICLCAVFAALVVVGTLVDVFHRWKNRQHVSSMQVLNSLEDTTNDSSHISVNSGNPNQSEYEDSASLVTVPKHSKKSTFRDLLLCFSAVRNGESILDTSSSKEDLQCVHGIRFLSMAWIILCHIYDFSLMELANVLDLADKTNSWPIQVVLQGSYSVDTFFVLSGCLLTYLFLKNKERFVGAKSWIMFYVHRYVRLTPVYAMLLFVLATWWNSLGSGPFWNHQNSETCSKTWWWNILYINNYLDDSKMCMAWGWYLANDMQFYIISPLFLIAFKRSRVAGLLVVLGLLVASWITTGIISRLHDLPVMFANNEQDMTDFRTEITTIDQIIYMKPYTRIGTYLIGALLGYFLIRAHGSRNFLHKSVVIFGWVISQTLSLLLLYGMFKAQLGPITSAAHNTLARSAWAISVSWVIYACLTGHAGPVNTLLSWKVWIPLSRLTYCAYLVHPMVMMWYIMSLKSLIYYSDSTIVILYLSFVALSYGVAFVASLLFEAPIMKLEKFLRNR